MKNNEKYVALIGTVESHKQAVNMFNSGLKMGLSLESQIEFINRELKFGLVNHECYAKLFMAVDQCKTTVADGLQQIAQHLLSMKNKLMVEQNLSEEEFEKLILPEDMLRVYHKMKTIDEVIEILESCFDPVLQECVVLQTSMITDEKGGE